MESTKEQVYRRIKYEIIVCRLEPGAPLNEKVLMEQYGIGRTPLREVMIRLQQEGLIQRFPRSGTIVAPMDINQLRNVTEIRIALEGLVGELVVERITDEQIQELKSILMEADKVMHEGTEEDLVNYDTRLHEFLYEITGNSRLINTIEELQAIGSRFWFSISFTRDEYQDQLNQWQKIITAIENRQKKQTQTLLQRHVYAAIERIKRCL